MKPEMIKRLAREAGMVEGPWANGNKERIWQENRDFPDALEMFASLIEKENSVEIENERVLSKAAYDSVSSLLLSVQKDCIAERKRADEAEAELARKNAVYDAAEYILDGMGISSPDYLIDPEDDFLDAANSEWVTDTLTRLADAMKIADSDLFGLDTEPESV